MQEEGISEEELSFMLQHAAITSVRGFNNRYFHWLFRVEKGQLQDMQHADLMEVGTGKTRMLEEHEDCHGKGCRKCGWIGQIGRWVTDKVLPGYEPLHLKV